MTCSITNELLCLDSLHTGYGTKEILNGVSFAVGAGETVALIGHNGAGKSTLLKAAFGLLSAWRGRVLFDGEPVDIHSTRFQLRGGLVYVPQGNRVFEELTVSENLAIAGTLLNSQQLRAKGQEHALDMFPSLRGRLEQRARTLSGGEKQVLALANAFMLSPRLLLLDEPSLGLSPDLAILALKRIRQLCDEEGVGILIVEQKVRDVLRICDRVCCIRLGAVTYSGPPEMLLEDEEALRHVFL